MRLATGHKHTILGSFEEGSQCLEDHVFIAIRRGQENLVAGRQLRCALDALSVVAELGLLGSSVSGHGG